MSEEQPLLELKSISKQYPGCLANDDISLRMQSGEIHALLGENGAGKSTLVKMIYGLLKPSSGTISWKGTEVSIDNPSVARSLGIAMVFQHFSLFEALTVEDNIALGMDENISHKALSQQIVDLSNSYGLPLKPMQQVHHLSVGERQRIEIIRCLLQKPQLLIMDEPTSVLTPQEVEQLFLTLRRLKEQGVSILYISHKLEEIKSLCDKATILRDGKWICECVPSQESTESLARLMIGETPLSVNSSRSDLGEVVLSVNHLSLKSTDQYGIDLDKISFAIRSGEILAIAGVAGNGQTELLGAISGEQLTPDKTVEIYNTACGRSGPNRRRQLGMAFVPEQRLGHGAVPSMSLSENTILTGFSKQGLVNRSGLNYKRSAELANHVRDQFKVKSSDHNDAAASLSGGNLQKFIVGREILQEPDILVLGQPTWGVDAGSAAAIQAALLQLAEQGAAILIVSQDLDELMLLADKIAVLSNGKLSEFKPVDQVDAQSLGLLMGGADDSLTQSSPNNNMKAANA